MSLHDLFLMLLGAFLDIVATVAIVFFPELLDFLQALMSGDNWPGEG